MTDYEVTRRTAIGAFGAVAAIAAPTAGAEVRLMNDDHAMKSFVLTALLKQREDHGRPYHQFLDEPTLSAGIYRLPAGATDNQSPHDLDEVYYVIEGDAKFEAADETLDVKPGTVLFVKAGADHRFLEIDKDLVILVLFSKART